MRTCNILLQSHEMKEVDKSDFLSENNKQNEVIDNEVPIDDVENGSDEYDIGRYVDNHSNISDDLKHTLLKKPWMPSNHYNFKNDIVVGIRPFLFKWFSIYPWLAYSKLLKGTFCTYCVLFHTHITHGSFQGHFITKPFQRYQKFLEKANNHSKTQWHIESSSRFNDFINMKNNVHQMINSNYSNKIVTNRKKLTPILSSLYFCALHNLPIRGKSDDSAVFNKLLQFRIDAGDTILKDHLENAPKNLTYISHRTQNELLESMSVTLKSVLTQEINEATCFSIIADETADISGIEQLSICIRFLKNNNIYEEFIGFYPLEEFDAKFISKTILEACSHMRLDMNKCVGQGYDGCATMAGHISGVQKRIKDMYPRAHFFHCASHRLNLVINDLNALTEVRNCISKIKDTITFFKESAVRMNVISIGNCKLTKLCETRFVEKHKSVRQFNEKFIVIVEGLEEMSTSHHFNNKTRDRSLEILNSITTPSFVILLSIIAKYSAKFEFISTVLQGVDIDLQEATQQIQDLLKLLKNERSNSECQFDLIFKKAEETAIKIGLELQLPRRANRQTQRDNYPTNDIKEFFRQSLFIPYLDSIIMSINDRFSDENLKAFSLFSLHPKKMKKMSIQEFSKVVKSINHLYGPLLDNFEEEAITWYEFWLRKPCDPSTQLIDLLEICKYYPAVKKALEIAISLPATSCSVERTFR